MRRLAHGEQDRPGDVVRLERPISRPRIEERRVDHAGLDQRHPDARVVELLARRLTHRRHRVLGRRVQGALQRSAAGDRARQDQVAAALAQGVDRRPDGVGGAEHVGEDHRAPLLRRLGGEAALGAEASVGEDDVDAAEALERGGGHRLLLVPLGDVAGDRERALVAAQLRGQSLEAVARARREHEAVTLRGGGVGGGGADAARRAGDQEDGVGQSGSFQNGGVHDRAKIHVEAGAGGNGCLSFRREAHVPKGGPDGGDGGRGGDVVVVCDNSLRDLQRFRKDVHIKAGRGGHGQGAQRHGADGVEAVVRVPPETEVHGLDGARFDFVAPGHRAVVACGGAGGRGNKRFASATRQAPRLAERGLPGEKGWVELRLKLLADAGLIGLPNAGKSSLLARLTRAAPKVADYPFTTLEPVLGTLEADDRQLVLADIPGLIEGASEGAGLGHDFLAHVERTRLLVHVLDLAPLDGSDPVENYETIEAELTAHDPRLAGLPRILALSKADLVPPEEAAAAAAVWGERVGDDVPVIVTSAVTRAGLEELAAELLHRVPLEAPRDAGAALVPEAELAEHRTFRPAAARGWQVEGVASGGFRVTGEPVERLLARHDLDNDEALAHVEHRLHRMGVVRALEAAGFEPGDDVEIAGVVFELDPG